jgi:hypothetical protein
MDRPPEDRYDLKNLIINKINKFCIKTQKLLIFSPFYPCPEGRSTKNQKFGKVPLRGFRDLMAF